MSEAPPEGLFLIIEDDALFGRVLARALARRGHRVALAATVEEALRLAPELAPERVVLDLNLAGASGLPLIAPLLAIVPECRIVVLTGYASIATAVEAIKLGATHYLAKPADVDAILAAFAPQPPGTQAAPPAQPLSVRRLEWEHIQRVLAEHDGNISATARALRMHRRTLQRKLMKRPVRG
ncbi:MAG: two-component system response regulator [Betaproteobacteria bacterium CG2_30_68_42]|nr:MAG: two-component system response regulator [Betaproteobacteria bacterium CG2_30_68_42]